MRTLLISLLLVGGLLAQDPPKMKDNAKFLKPLGFLVGSWVGKGKMDGMEFTAEVKYSWTLNKNFIKTDYVAKAGSMTVWTDTGMIGWDLEKKMLVSFSFGMDGSIGHGEYKQQKDGKTWIIKVSINSSDPRFKDGRAIMKQIDKDNYSSDIQTKRDGKYVSFMTCTYKRKKVREGDKR